MTHISESGKNSAIISIVISFFLLAGAAGKVSAEHVRFSMDSPPQGQTRALLSEMSDEEALGQLFMLGFSGTTPSADILKWIEKYNLGGVKIFGWNVRTLPELAKTVGELQSAAVHTRLKIPLFVATDQEGGWVRHVKAGTSETAGNIAIGATGLPYDAFQSGYYIGMELRALGINMNFAPTVDVYTNPQAHVIGPRAFSDDPVETGTLAVASFKGMQAAGIIATAKHYPGHGGAHVDSHNALPVINRTFDQLWQCDLLPYRFLIKEGLPAIMGGHLAFPLITGDKKPATLSKYFHTELLRDKMGFRGLTITDDLLMNGIMESGYSMGEICVLAVEAGNDMLLLSRGPDLYEHVHSYLLRKMKDDKNFEGRVFEAAGRILDVKQSYLTGENAVPLYPDPETVEQKVPDPEGKQFFFNLACRSVTVIRRGNIPLEKDRLGKILLAGQFPRFFQEGKKRFPEADEFYYPFSPFYFSDSSESKALEDKISKYDTIIFCLANPNSQQVLEKIIPAAAKSGTDIIVFSVLTPVYLEKLPGITSAIAVYGISRDSFEAGFAVLSGDYQAEGTPPLSALRE